jgi:hypothetical protein
LITDAPGDIRHLIGLWLRLATFLSMRVVNGCVETFGSDRSEPIVPRYISLSGDEIRPQYGDARRWLHLAKLLSFYITP